MKIKDVPEAEASKLRLLKELPLKWHEDVMKIINAALNWEVAKRKINEYLLEKGIHIKNISILFASRFPVGEQRINKR